MSNEEDRAALDIAVMTVLTNVMNFPEKVQARLLGQDMRPLGDRVIDAVLDAGFHRTPAPALPQEMYAPEVFERMKALLQEAHGSPMRARRLAVSTPQDTEWEYGAGYEADNGIEMRWFSIGSGAFTIREAAEREVERFADPQVRLVRRTRPGPWEPVPTEGVSE